MYMQKMTFNDERKIAEELSQITRARLGLGLLSQYREVLMCKSTETYSWVDFYQQRTTDRLPSQ
jgi:hypothetical protein